MYRHGHPDLQVQYDGPAMVNIHPFRQINDLIHLKNKELIVKCS